MNRDISILNNIKGLIGPSAEDTHFDSDIILHINTAFSVLTRLGVGPAEGFYIEDATAVWGDFLPQVNCLEIVKTYVYINVKLIFDPPAVSSVIELLKQTAKEAEWRIVEIMDSLPLEKDT